jgi:hypothetical protein
MKIKILFLFLSILILISGPSQVRATVIHLDGIANAGWSSDDFSKAHLYIADPDNSGTYYYQWTYSFANPAPLWNSRQALANDLNDGNGVLVNGNPVGNWKIESGGDVFNNPGSTIWKSLTFSPGEYKLSLTPDSHAYQLNEFLWGNEGNYSTPIWNAYVQMYVEYNDGSNTSFNFGDWSQAQGTEGDVLALYHSTIDGMVLNLTKAGTIYFYINDYNSVDNGGSVSLEFDKTCPVPVPGGLLLLGSALVSMYIRRRSVAN